MRFEFIRTKIDNLLVLQRLPIHDARGYFERMFCDKDLKEILESRKITQINHNLNIKLGTVRGMHYQNPPYAEMKIVSCLKGSVYDVAVDLRVKSKTFLEWHGEILSEKNKKSLIIPEGFAHGFQSLEDETELIYFTTEEYSADHECGINPLDPVVGIKWPLKINSLSVKDTNLLHISESFAGVNNV